MPACTRRPAFRPMCVHRSRRRRVARTAEPGGPHEVA